MASQRMLIVEKDLCYGCHTCEVACKQEHMLPAGINFIRVDQDGPRREGGRLKMDFIPVICTHCERPPCVDACPVNAIQKRSDGIVLIDLDLCDGCEKCIGSCPFGAIRFHQEKSIAVKCDLCASRIREGRLPACVHHCPTGALIYGDPTAVVEDKSRVTMATSHRLLKDRWRGGFY